MYFILFKTEYPCGCEKVQSKGKKVQINIKSTIIFFAILCTRTTTTRRRRCKQKGKEWIMIMCLNFILMWYNQHLLYTHTKEPYAYACQNTENNNNLCTSCFPYSQFTFKFEINLCHKFCFLLIIIVPVSTTTPPKCRSNNVPFFAFSDKNIYTPWTHILFPLTNIDVPPSTQNYAAAG